MSIYVLMALLAVSGSVAAGADTDWKPKPEEAYVVGDLRFEAADIYRDAEIIMRVYSEIRSRQRIPGDPADLLLTDFQPIAARYILKPFQFLSQYPDPQLTAELLRFQVTQTSGIWPPWKLVALRLFNEQPDAFSAIFDTHAT